MEKRTKEIKIRLTDDEHQRLLDRSQRTHLAEWLRELGLGERTPSRRRKLPDVDPQLFRQIVGMGNNLNQIARKLNQMESLRAEDTIRLLSLLTSIDRQLTETLEHHRDR
ncbi:MobC family plasmid mobilization relaxosome protein [Salmonella enterica subsp. enterica serovar Edinburgh]|nr:MobC family plasmid mobilization relaxosome protein [Salmonella enterica subsp. enterica serovar Edinburgh]EBH8946428.1 plasmid mobilization relaxosome protein MobC [Salmonella enterica subsp. enterica serovar 6,7:b:-]EJA5741192.1 plasmid mobilization relaxosome protein MobC [Salmonella enterica]EJA5755257.1 plasmid mobilization relaxosome protein MobC [Salmonella enterica]EJX4155964.1 plasmid mobilization relaxosome protein MobC [Salmonella enterica]